MIKTDQEISQSTKTLIFDFLTSKQGDPKKSSKLSRLITLETLVKRRLLLASDILNLPFGRGKHFAKGYDLMRSAQNVIGSLKWSGWYGKNKLRGLYDSKARFEGLIFRGAYIRRGLSTKGKNICVSKSIGLAL